jgi:fumarate hydratase class II
MSATRRERDSFGGIEVPADRLWGAQTQRSLEHFSISKERLPEDLVHGACRGQARPPHEVNAELGLARCGRQARSAIAAAAEEVRRRRPSSTQEFPLSVWQTGSGTQSNMNVNEVLAQPATQALAQAALPAGEAPRRPCRTTRSISGSLRTTSSPAPRILAAATGIAHALRQALARLSATLAGQIGRVRRHREDRPHAPAGRHAGCRSARSSRATSRSSSWPSPLLDAALSAALPLAIGGTAVGTGLNTHPEFGARVAARLPRAAGCKRRSPSPTTCSRRWPATTRWSACMPRCARWRWR